VNHDRSGIEETRELLAQKQNLRGILVRKQNEADRWVQGADASGQLLWECVEGVDALLSRSVRSVVLMANSDESEKPRRTERSVDKNNALRQYPPGEPPRATPGYLVLYDLKADARIPRAPPEGSLKAVATSSGNSGSKPVRFAASSPLPYNRILKLQRPRAFHKASTIT
jgi:hypothetical protein